MGVVLIHFMNTVEFQHYFSIPFSMMKYYLNVHNCYFVFLLFNFFDYLPQFN